MVCLLRYGMHHMLNLVTGPEGYPAAILIRGLETTSGPARTDQDAWDRPKAHRSPVSPESGLYLEDTGIVIPKKLIHSTPRIGVDYAGPIWSSKPWRFQLLRGDKFK